MTGDNFYGLEVGSTEEVPMSDGIQDVVSFAGGEICHKWRKNWLQVWNWWDKEWKELGYFGQINTDWTIVFRI